MTSKERLARLAVGEFVAKVASTEAPVPAGGSVAALAGACAAALLALASGVLAKRGVAGAAELHERADGLQAELLALVDEDAQAYAAYLSAHDNPAVIQRVTTLPLQVAEHARAVRALSEEVQITGAVVGDVRAARRLAEAAAAAALDLAETNLTLERDPQRKHRLTSEIERLRG
jgi:formiminotetrahydrofolate cyclodeaminase